MFHVHGGYLGCLPSNGVTLASALQTDWRVAFYAWIVDSHDIKAFLHNLRVEWHDLDQQQQRGNPFGPAGAPPFNFAPSKQAIVAEFARVRVPYLTYLHQLGPSLLTR